jgi:hypothetical protein
LILMRDFSWQYFSITGDVDAYLLYKEIESDHVPTEAKAEDDVKLEPNEML